MAIFHWDVDQNSIDWHRLRSGIPTASMFDKIITPAKMDMSAQRFPYACRLIAERLMNWQPQSLDNLANIAAGKEREPEAVKKFEFVTDSITRTVGFVTTNDGKFGASPDRIVGHRQDAPPPTSVDVVAEVKCPTIPVQMIRLASTAILRIDPKAKVIGGRDYACQVQGQLFVAEAESAVFYSYEPRMPAFMLTTYRDEAFIRKLADALEQFHDEIEAIEEYVVSRGTFQAFAELLTPLDAERRPGTMEELADMIEGDAGDKLAWGG